MDKNTQHTSVHTRRPPSVASSTTSQKRPATGASSRTGNHRQQSKTMNASMSIWQIQSTLKRGEMVQVCDLLLLSISKIAKTY